jgi:hypothetical protein
MIQISIKMSNFIIEDINGCIFYTKPKHRGSKCQNSGVRVDAENSTRQKMLIMGTLNKYGN